MLVAQLHFGKDRHLGLLQPLNPGVRRRDGRAGHSQLGRAGGQLGDPELHGGPLAREFRRGLAQLGRVARLEHRDPRPLGEQQAAGGPSAPAQAEHPDRTAAQGEHRRVLGGGGGAHHQRIFSVVSAMMPHRILRM